MYMTVWQLVKSCWRKQCAALGGVDAGAERKHQARDGSKSASVAGTVKDGKEQRFPIHRHLPQVQGELLLKQRNAHIFNVLIVYYLSILPG